MIPRTPRQRADDLKEIGARVTKRVGFKRGEFIVECPTCGRQGVDFGGVKWLKPDVVERGAKDGHHRARTNFDDETFRRGTVWQSKHSGDRSWRECRAHLLACTDDDLDDEKRRVAIHAVHTLSRAIDAAPEMLPKVLAELARVVDSLPVDQHVGRTLGDAVFDAARWSLDHAPPHRPDATREARGLAAKENASRASQAKREMLAAFAPLLPGAK